MNRNGSRPLHNTIQYDNYRVLRNECDSSNRRTSQLVHEQRREKRYNQQQVLRYVRCRPRLKYSNYGLDCSLTRCRASEATRAVNLTLVNSHPNSANILSDVWEKSIRKTFLVLHQWANSSYEKVVSCFEKGSTVGSSALSVQVKVCWMLNLTYLSWTSYGLFQMESWASTF